MRKIVILSMVIFVGCAVIPKVYISPDLHKERLSSIGVVGFRAPGVASGDYVADLFTAELLRQLGDRYKIVPPSLLQTEAKETIGKEEIKRLGERFGLDAVLIGSIGEWGYLKEGEEGMWVGWEFEDVDRETVVIAREAPSDLAAVALSIHLIDPEDGKILFSAQYARRVGRGESIGRLAQEMVERLVDLIKDAIQR
jgi:hypothetical protein